MAWVGWPGRGVVGVARVGVARLCRAGERRRPAPPPVDPSAGLRRDPPPGDRCRKDRNQENEHSNQHASFLIKNMGSDAAGTRHFSPVGWAKIKGLIKAAVGRQGREEAGARMCGSGHRVYQHDERGNPGAQEFASKKRWLGTCPSFPSLH